MTRTARARRSVLRRLARAYGVQTAYRAVDGQRRTVGEEALAAVLQSLGAPVDTDDPGSAHATDALREKRLMRGARPVPPIAAVWEDRPAAVPLRLRTNRIDRRVGCELVLESGETRSWHADPDRMDVRETVDVEGERLAVLDLALPEPLPFGYHRLRVEHAGTSGETRLISAPTRAYTPEDDDNDGAGRARRRAWGVFLPLYALRTRDDWGVGDTTGLAALARWTAERGGDLVATLPLLPTFLGDDGHHPRSADARPVPFEPSPYSPVTRLFWNEIYADVARAPGLARCSSAQMLLNSTALRNALDRLRDEPRVDYAAVMRIKRQVLEALADCVFSEASPELDELRTFIEDRPRLRRYARFRADGATDGSDARDRLERYHLYTQWLMHRQLDSIAAEADDGSAGLHIDLPLGVHPRGFDVWDDPDLFARGASAGAPPDAFFARGQSWGFPPLRPDAMRERGCDYTIACIRHHMRHAHAIRVDHVMSLHRLYWVPDGFEPTEGAYVRYPTEPLYAILCLESHRHRVRVIGEDLGTVPREVRRMMGRHGLHRTYALPFALDADRTPRRPHRRSVAMLGTHDMPTFAAFWRGDDIDDRRALGLIDAADARREADERARVRDALITFLREHGRLPDRADDPAAVLHACLAWLAAGPARIMLVDLEDLWLETRPHNVPGTTDERPNWRHRARLRLDELDRATVLEPLGAIDRLRAGEESG